MSVNVASRSIKEQHVIFAFTLIIESTTEKVLQFIMPMKSIYNQKIIAFLNTYREVQTMKLH